MNVSPHLQRHPVPRPSRALWKVLFSEVITDFTFRSLLRGQIINIRYLAYFDNILDFIKDRILVYHGYRTYSLLNSSHETTRQLVFTLSPR